MKTYVALTTKLSPEIAKALESYVKASGRTKADVIASALKEYLEKQKTAE